MRARAGPARSQPARAAGAAGLRLASRYLPPSAPSGGDWFDVFPLPGGVDRLAIGDVVGHGIEAGAEAVRLRDALRVAVLGGHDLAGTVVGAQRARAPEEGAFASTVLYLELELRPAACAGRPRHVPAILAARRQRAVARDGGRAAARRRTPP